MRYESSISFNGSSGIEITGIIGVPDGSGPFPAVVVLHGNGGWKEEEHIAGLAADLVEAGIVALRFDATGIGESGGKHPENFRIPTYRKDISAALDTLTAHPGIDAGRIGVAGHSLGGMLAVMAASADKRIQAVCAISPSHIRNQTVSTMASLPLWRAQGYREITNPHHGVLRLPVSFYDDIDEGNAVEAARTLTIPLMVIAGTADDVVLPSESHQIYEARPTNSQWLLLPDIDHFYKRNPHQVALVNRHIIDFFASSLSLRND